MEATPSSVDLSAFTGIATRIVRMEVSGLEAVVSVTEGTFCITRYTAITHCADEQEFLQVKTTDSCAGLFIRR